MECHETVHKIKEPYPSLAFEMTSSDLPCGHIQCRKQGARSVAFVFMGKARERTSVRHFQPALGAFECLNAGLFIKAEHHRILRLGQVEADDIGGFFGELRIGGEAPAPAAFEADAQLPEDLSDTVRADFQGFAKQRAVPSCVSGRGRRVESREQSGLKRLVILFHRASRGENRHADH